MGNIHFKPETELTFKTVVSVRAQLQKLLVDDTRGCFCLDLSEVKHCDSAGLALLLEARKLCKRSNKTFELIGISPETHSLAEFCGIDSILATI